MTEVGNIYSGYFSCFLYTEMQFIFLDIDFIFCDLAKFICSFVVMHILYNILYKQPSVVREFYIILSDL